MTVAGVHQGGPGPSGSDGYRHRRRTRGALSLPQAALPGYFQNILSVNMDSSSLTIIILAFENMKFELRKP